MDTCLIVHLMFVDRVPWHFGSVIGESVCRFPLAKGDGICRCDAVHARRDEWAHRADRVLISVFAHLSAVPIPSRTKAVCVMTLRNYAFRKIGRTCRFLTPNARTRGLPVWSASSTMPTFHPHVSLSLVGGQDHRAASDGDVARALSAGETWAAVETWRRFAPMVLTLAKRALGSQSEAEDIGQEAFCRVYRKVKTLREPDSFRNFVYACALRVLQNELRRKKMRSWLRFEQPEWLDSRGCGTLDVESRDLLWRFYRLLDRLAPRDRIVFVLRRVESMSVEEIAVSMQTSESTVKRSLVRASSRLSRWMDDEPRLADGEKWGR